MIKTKGAVRRPPKENSYLNQGNSSTTSPGQSTGKIAYLSLPSIWSDEIKDQVLQRVRNDLPDLRVESFRTAFTLSELLADPPTWWERVQGFITKADALIVAADQTGVVGPGIRWELRVALRARKLVVVYDVTTGCPRQYFGFDPVEEKSIRLRDRKLAPDEQKRVDRQHRRRRLKRKRYEANRRKRQMEGMSIPSESGEGGDLCQLN